MSPEKWIVLGVGMAAVLAFGVFVAASISGGLAVPSIGGTVEQRAVRAYLKANSPSGTWEEIEWYPAKAFKTGGSIIELKFRTKNPFGGQTVFRNWFTVQDGKVVTTNCVF